MPIWYAYILSSHSVNFIYHLLTSWWEQWRFTLFISSFLSPTCLHPQWAKIQSATEISLLSVLNQLSFDSIPELAWNSTATSIGFYCHPIRPETRKLPGKKGSLCFMVVPADILIVQPCSGTLISSVSLPPCHSWGVGAFIKGENPIPGLLLPPWWGWASTMMAIHHSRSY